MRIINVKNFGNNCSVCLLAMGSIMCTRDFRHLVLSCAKENVKKEAIAGDFFSLLVVYLCVSNVYAWRVCVINRDLIWLCANEEKKG